MINKYARGKGGEVKAAVIAEVARHLAIFTQFAVQQFGAIQPPALWDRTGLNIAFVGPVQLRFRPDQIDAALRTAKVQRI